MPDAQPGTRTLRLDFVYQDQEFEEHTSEELLNIPIAQAARLEAELANLWIPPFISMFDSIPLEFRVVNSGRVPLRNVRVRVDGEFDTRETNIFLTNLSDGSTVMYRGLLRPSIPGHHEGAIVVYAEDETGEIIEFVHPFEIFVEDFPVWDEGGRGDDG